MPLKCKKFSGGACPQTPLGLLRAFGARELVSLLGQLEPHRASCSLYLLALWASYFPDTKSIPDNPLSGLPIRGL